jgi:hypothetical protein
MFSRGTGHAGSHAKTAGVANKDSADLDYFLVKKQTLSDNVIQS